MMFQLLGFYKCVYNMLCLQRPCKIKMKNEKFVTNAMIFSTCWKRLYLIKTCLFLEKKILWRNAMQFCSVDGGLGSPGFSKYVIQHSVFVARAHGKAHLCNGRNDDSILTFHSPLWQCCVNVKIMPWICSFNIYN